MTALPTVPRKLFLFVNGINTDAEAHVTNWNARAERWVESRGVGLGDTYTYHVTTLQRWLEQDRHIDAAVDCLKDRFASGWRGEVILVGHSNGAAIVCGMLARHPELRVSEIHLIAGAVDRDYDKNGLNAAVERGQVIRIYVYRSGTDSALKWAKWTRWMVGWLGLGYGWLGLNGPKNMSREADARTSTLVYDGYDHGDYFVGDNFDRTMGLVTNAD